MSDQLKVVNPVEVRAYGTRINNRVDEMFNELNLLCANVVEVDYFGANAFRFKTDAGQKATEFANNMANQINALKDGVSKATSNISGSLGGQPITIDVSDNTITPGTPQADSGTQIANPTALDDLVSQVGTRFDSLRSSIDGLKQLPGNDRNGWMGQARDQTEDFVNQWCSSAKSSCDTSQESLTTFITSQRDSVVAADRA